MYETAFLLAGTADATTAEYQELATAAVTVQHCFRPSVRTETAREIQDAAALYTLIVTRRQQPQLTTATASGKDYIQRTVIKSLSSVL
jgi:hypothetical protein